MDPLWLLKGDYDASGWKPLERDAKAESIDWVLFDRDGWVLIRAAEPPTQYEGLVPEPPPDGLYIDQQGSHVYVLDAQLAKTAESVIDALGDEAKALFEKHGDPMRVLQALGRAY